MRIDSAFHHIFGVMRYIHVPFEFLKATVTPYIPHSSIGRNTEPIIQPNI